MQNCYRAGEYGRDESTKVVNGTGQLTAGQAQRTVRHFYLYPVLRSHISWRN